MTVLALRVAEPCRLTNLMCRGAQFNPISSLLPGKTSAVPSSSLRKVCCVIVRNCAKPCKLCDIPAHDIKVKQTLCPNSHTWLSKNEWLWCNNCQCWCQRYFSACVIAFPRSAPRVTCRLDLVTDLKKTYVQHGVEEASTFKQPHQCTGSTWLIKK